MLGLGVSRAPGAGTTSRDPAQLFLGAGEGTSERRAGLRAARSPCASSFHGRLTANFAAFHLQTRRGGEFGDLAGGCTAPASMAQTRVRGEAWAAAGLRFPRWRGRRAGNTVCGAELSRARWRRSRLCRAVL